MKLWLLNMLVILAIVFGITNAGEEEDTSDLECNFEKNFCGWFHSKLGDFRWKRRKGKTPSSNTGPSNDHTPGRRARYYAYIETSFPRKELDFAMLRSGSFDVEDECCFSLWFNANGKDIGSLILLDDFTNIGNYLGDRGDVWRKTSHTLSKGQHKLSIIGVRGKGFRGDLAIDDIEIEEGPCPKSVCSDQPCVHGFCIGTPGKISCICDSDYTGKYCDQQLVGQLQEQPLIISTNKCANNPCKNGFCIQTPERSTCVCSPGFRGDRCDIADPSSN